MILKFPYIRSKKLLKLVATLDCQICGSGLMVQAAHSNMAQHGKGRGIKASDEFVAALCFTCHANLDQGKMSKHEKSQMWHNAHAKTIEMLDK